MMNSIISTTLYVAMVSLVRCEPPSSNYGTPIGAPLSSYGEPNYQGSGHDHHGHGHDYNGEPKSYEFGYQVKDEYTGTDYNRKESSDGNQVRGEYRVALPDGRTQIVTYWADWQSGFHADVRYEGEAQYPDQYNKNGGYNDGGYSNGPSTQYGVPGQNNGYSGGHDGYNYNNNNNNNYDYNGGYNNNKPSSVYGPA